MVLPGHVTHAADVGDIAVVQAWLNNAARDAVNDVSSQGYTCLTHSMALYGGRQITRENVEVVRFLISRGADVNVCSGPDDWTALHYACCNPLGSGAVAMVSLLLQAGARVNARTGNTGYMSDPDSTPLEILVGNRYRERMSIFGEILIALLRAGASIDRCADHFSAETLSETHGDDDEDFTYEAVCREILAGVRAHGSYKRYARTPHREFLRFRSLLVRGRAKTNELNERIARLPNGACWKVLSYWREDN